LFFDENKKGISITMGLLSLHYLLTFRLHV